MPLLLILLVLLFLIAALVWNAAVRSQSPKRKPIEKLPEYPYEAIEWTSAGEPIQGWFIPPGSTVEDHEQPAPVIVIAHGWGSNRSSMLRYVPSLHEEGYAILLYDARGHGESGDVHAVSGLTMRDDLRAAIAYVATRPDIDRKRIGVIGHSLGAFGSILAAGSGEHRMKALVTDAMPAQISTMVAAELGRKKLPRFPFVQLVPAIIGLRSGAPRSQYDPILAINQSSTPILMIHSRGDDFIPSTELDYVIRHIVRKIDYLFLTNEGHGSAAYEDEFWNHTLSFFEKHLAPSDEPPKSSDQYQI